MDEQDYVRSPEGARHLAHAIRRLQPVAVVADTSLGSPSCRVASTGQFDKVAMCVQLAKAHEQRRRFKYDLLLRTRPDVLWLVSERDLLVRALRCWALLHRCS